MSNPSDLWHSLPTEILQQLPHELRSKLASNPPTSEPLSQIEKAQVVEALIASDLGRKWLVRVSKETNTMPELGQAIEKCIQLTRLDGKL